MNVIRGGAVTLPGQRRLQNMSAINLKKKLIIRVVCPISECCMEINRISFISFFWT